MARTKKTEKKIEVTIPSVLSFEKKLVVSDAYLYGTSWDDDHRNTAEPLKIDTKSVRGTISNRLKPALEKDPAKLNAEVEKANLQTVDSCSLNINQDTLKVVFTLKVLSGVEKPCACNSTAFAHSYAEAANKYIENTNFKVLGYRYAHNLANARFLWRNRLGAEKIDVLIDADDLHLKLDAHDFSIKEFVHNAKIDSLGEKIASVLSGENPFLLIKVTAYAKIGEGQEVYPSEELIFDKGKSDKSKVLYEVNGTAALHSQKVGNAIRTIDTWYPEFDTENGVGPIAIEPYGAITTMGKIFRGPKDKADFYTLFDKFALGEEITEDEEHYVMAVVVRGGVFGGKAE